MPVSRPFRRRLGALAVLTTGLLAGPVAQATPGLTASARVCDSEEGFGSFCDAHGISSPAGAAGTAAEFGPSHADVIQSYGVFHGSARAYLTVSGQANNLQGTSYHTSADAFGTFTDTLTIGGATGIGYLHLTYSIAGLTSSTGYGPGYDSDAFLTAQVNSTSRDANGSTLYGELESGLIRSSAVVDLSGSMPFFFNQPLDLFFFTAVEAKTGFDTSYYGTSFTGEAAAGFSDTAVLTSIRAFDALGNEIQGITIQAESGTVYPLVDPDAPVASVPEPSSAALLGLGLGVAALVGRRVKAAKPVLRPA